MALLKMKVSTELLNDMFLLPKDKHIVGAEMDEELRTVTLMISDPEAPEDVDEIQPVYSQHRYVKLDDIGYVKKHVIGFRKGKNA